MAVYGYCRISTPKQNIQRQERNIRAEYPDATIIFETYTGTKVQGRKELERLCNRLKARDTVVFDSVSRMSRNAEEGFTLYQRLYQDGINLVFLKEPHINTATYRKALAQSVPLTGTAVDYILDGVNRYLMELAREQIRLAFDQAEKEVSDLHQRTKEGIQTARMSGKQIGGVTGKTLTTKKSEDMKPKILKMSKDFGGNMTDKEVMEILHLSRNTFYKYKRELKA